MRQQAAKEGGGARQGTPPKTALQCEQPPCGSIPQPASVDGVLWVVQLPWGSRPQPASGTEASRTAVQPPWGSMMQPASPQRAVMRSQSWLTALVASCRSVWPSPAVREPAQTCGVPRVAARKRARTRREEHKRRMRFPLRKATPKRAAVPARSGLSRDMVRRED